MQRLKYFFLIAIVLISLFGVLFPVIYRPAVAYYAYFYGIRVSFTFTYWRKYSNRSAA